MSVTAPAGLVIRASELAEFQAANDIISAAHAEAEQIQRRAQEAAENLEQYCDEVRERARQQGLEQAEEEAPALRQQAVANCIQWLIENHNLEHSIVERLETRLRGILAQVFEEFYGQQSGARLLMSRLQEHIETLLGEEAGTLHVNETQFDELRQAFVTHPQLRIKLDTQLEPGEALLNTPLVSLYLNLDEQLQSILSRLEQLSQEASDDQQN
ncbi:hypothetical protein NG43_12235 [Winslowiella iniecta]|nr:hypothetical protein NG43_12235 [Winslowiella iniecta]